MLYLSASSIKDYLSCSMRYYYRRYKKTDAIESVDMQIGNAVHFTIEKYPDKLEDGLEYAEGVCFDYALGESSTEKVLSLVGNYYANYAYLTTKTDKVEYEFSIPYDRNVTIVGKMDRIVDGNSIIDWKTGSKFSKKLDKDPQFILYDWAYETIFKRRATDILLVSLATNDVVRYRRNDDYFNEFFWEVVPNIIDNVFSKEFVREGLYRYGSPCFKCTYKEVCYRELASRNNTFK